MVKGIVDKQYMEAERVLLRAELFDNMMLSGLIIPLAFFAFGPLAIFTAKKVLVVDHTDEQEERVRRVRKSVLIGTMVMSVLFVLQFFVLYAVFSTII